MLKTLLDLQNQLHNRTPGSGNWSTTITRILEILLQREIDIHESQALSEEIARTTDPSNF